MLHTTIPGTKEDGYIILAAVLILALLTIICVSALKISTTEMKIATNELLYERAFYTAEAGLQHSAELLKLQYVSRNSAILSAGGTPNLSFALQGALDSDEDGVGDLDGSVTMLDRKSDAIGLQVRIWNNDDGGGPTNDTDGLIYVQSEAGGPRGALCRIEMLLEGTISGEAISDYSAQAGAGPGKNFVSSDADVITDFTQTSLNAN
jgi:type IV pilus assembly protein PilX